MWATWATILRNPTIMRSRKILAAPQVLRVSLKFYRDSRTNCRKEYQQSAGFRLGKLFHTLYISSVIFSNGMMNRIMATTQEMLSKRGLTRNNVWSSRDLKSLWATGEREIGERRAAGDFEVRTRRGKFSKAIQEAIKGRPCLQSFPYLSLVAPPCLYSDMRNDRYPKFSVSAPNDTSSRTCSSLSVDPKLHPWNTITALSKSC